MAIATEESTSKYAQAGDLKIHYNEVGTGPALICIHGGGPGASGWSNYQRNVGPLSESFRVILPDMPGFGKSDKPEITGGRFALYARAVRDLMDQIGIEKASFIGNSMGGGTALKFAMEYPDRADRLVCMGPAGGVSLFQPMPTEGIRYLMGYYAPPGPSKEKMERFLRTIVYDQSRLNDELFEQRYQSSIQPELMNAPQSRNAVLEDLWKDLDKVPHKTLLIWGRDDRVVPMDGGIFMLQRMPDARLHIFSRCGHWAQWEKTDEFNALVKTFLTEG
ncbi:MAG TPA: alpha/beta fold hydrolase [Dehalococcoidia bacterium]|nr:alpha/beta fold hydrolase [Dehalococcoidia bacterium]